MQDFEVHITMKGNRIACEKAVKQVGNGWTFSCIDGDPLLGKDVFCYATNHYTTKEVAFAELDSEVRELLRRGMPVVRTKIESVIFDKRYYWSVEESNRAKEEAHN